MRRGVMGGVVLSSLIASYVYSSAECKMSEGYNKLGEVKLLSSRSQASGCVVSGVVNPG